MTDFTYVALGATALFVIGGLIAGVTDTPKTTVETPGDGTTEGDVLFQEDIGVIGNINQTERTVFEADTIEVAYESPNSTVTSMDELTIRQGGFGEPNSKVVQFDARQPEALYVTFTVAGSNPAGDLLLKLNGHTAKRFTPEEGRTYTVKLTNVSAGSNTLFLTAKNTGYAFWAATEYQLQDVEVVVKDMAIQRNMKGFRLYPYEVGNFDTGTIRFFVNEQSTATAPLKIDINGNTVMERRPVKRNLVYEERFTRTETDLHPGENTISFYTQPGAEYTLSTVRAGIEFYVTTNTRTISDSFSIPRITYRLMKEDAAQLRFDVEAVKVQAPLRITLNNETYSVQPDVGEQTIDVAKEVLQRGDNTVRVTTTGSYEIANFRVVKRASDDG